MRHANKGRSLETLVLSSTRDVRLEKIPHAAKFIGKGRMIRQRSGCDFMGVYVPTGRAMVFDAKSCANPNRLETHADHLPPHQREQIIAYGRSGAIAGILAESTHHRRLYWLHWLALESNLPSYEWTRGLMFDVGSAAKLVNWAAVAGADSGYVIVAPAGGVQTKERE